MSQLPPLRFQPARDSAFRRELRARADAYLASEGKPRFGDAREHGKTVFLAALLVHGLDGARRLWWPAAAGTRA